MTIERKIWRKFMKLGFACSGVVLWTGLGCASGPMLRDFWWQEVARVIASVVTFSTVG